MGVRLLYLEYKNHERKAFKSLDPEKELHSCKRDEVRQKASGLLGKLSEPLRYLVLKDLSKSIRAREECAKHYASSSSRARWGHQWYIEFLKYLEQQLEMLIETDQQATVTTRKGKIAVRKIEQPPVVDLGELSEDQQAHMGGNTQHANVEDKDGEEFRDEDALTLRQIDFLNFLDLLMGLTRQAAELWTEVAEDTLPTWVASTLCGILLREAQNLVSAAKLVDEDPNGNQSPKSPAPWADTEYPQLNQDWVDMLDQLNQADKTWWQLTKTLPEFEFTVTLVLSPCYQFAPGYKPHGHDMLMEGAQTLRDHKIATPTSGAHLPLGTLICLYFYSLVRGLVEGTKKSVDLELLSAKANTALVANLDILPRLVTEECVMENDAESFRKSTDKIMAWAKACKEPASLGYIHFLARMQWVDWHWCLASSSVPLQVALYLYEMRRLQAHETTYGGRGSNDEYEHLLAALMEDSRVAPAMLMDGRPKRIQQCIRALRDWCCMPTTDSETALSLDMPNKWIQQVNSVKRSVMVRQAKLIGKAIVQNDYGYTRDLQHTVAAWDRKRKKTDKDHVSAGQGSDGDALRRYLIWESSAPNCLELEDALYGVLRKLPEWKNILADSILNSLLSQRQIEWHTAIRTVVDQGLHVLFSQAEIEAAFGSFEISRSLQLAIIKFGLEAPSHELEATFTEIFHGLATKWQGSFGDQLLRATKKSWQRTFKTFLKSPSLVWKVETTTYLSCLLPQERNKSPSKEKKPRSEVVGSILEEFLEEAGPILKKAYAEPLG